MKTSNRRGLSAFVAGAAAVGICVPANSAHADDFATGPLLSTKVRTANSQARTESTDFSVLNLLGNPVFPAVQFTVPPGQRRVFQAEFNAESSCGGQGPAVIRHCLVRIVAVKTGGGGTTQLQPTDNLFGNIFDSVPIPDRANEENRDSTERHTLQGTTELGPGTYGFFVEFAGRVPGVRFFLNNPGFSVQEFAALGATAPGAAPGTGQGTGAGRTGRDLHRHRGRLGGAGAARAYPGVRSLSAGPPDQPAGRPSWCATRSKW